LAADRVYWELLLLPILWCVVTGATLWTMESPDAFVVPLAALLGVAFAVWKARTRRQSNRVMSGAPGHPVEGSRESQQGPRCAGNDGGAGD